MAEVSPWGVDQPRKGLGGRRHRINGSLGRFSTCKRRRWLAAFPKGFRDLCCPPLGVTRFLHMLPKIETTDSENDEEAV